MTIPVPTIDQFNETTVMTVIRNVVDYIIGLVPQINNGDVTDLTLNYQGSTLTVGFIKGDGTQISKNVTIESGGGATNPYPTDVNLSLSGSTLNCDILLSDNNHVTGSVDLSPLVPSVTGFVTEEELQQVQSDLQEQITGLKLSTSNNNMTLNGDSVQIVKTVSGTVSNGNLQITVNGVSSGDIPLPESGGVVDIQSIYPITPASISGTGASNQCIALSTISTKSLQDITVINGIAYRMSNNNEYYYYYSVNSTTYYGSYSELSSSIKDVIQNALNNIKSIINSDFSFSIVAINDNYPNPVVPLFSQNLFIGSYTKNTDTIKYPTFILCSTISSEEFNNLYIRVISND